VEIEEVAAKTPEKIIKVHIDPLLGLRDYQARDIAASIDLPRELWRDFSKIASGLWQAYKETDAELAEINPLVITKDKKLVALDGKMLIDDNSLFRHSDIAEIRDTDEEAPAETEARRHGLSFIKLDGNIGCMVNGAGLAMTSMDIVKLFGGEPANFLDIGGFCLISSVALPAVMKWQREFWSRWMKSSRKCRWLCAWLERMQKRVVNCLRMQT